MTDKIKAFWLGLFLVLTLALLIWLVMFLKPGVGDGKVQLKVHFSNIDKISKGSLVTYAGKPIGKVSSIREVKHPHKAPPDQAGNLYVFELILDVDSSVQIYSYDEIVFATAGLLGEKSISIIPKATPKGAPAARNITQETLYAESSDKINQTLTKLCSVGDTLQEAMENLCCFIKSNQSDFNLALKSFTRSTDQIENIITKACTTQMVEKMATASDCLSIAATEAERFFIAIDNAYILPQLRSILEDINDYGLLYQFDRKWKRHRALEQRICTDISCENDCRK